MPSSSRHDLDAAADGLLAGAAVDPVELLEAEAAAARRRRFQRIGALLIALVVFGAIGAMIATVGFSGSAPAGGTAPRVALKSEGVGVLVIRPGEQPERIAAAAPIAGTSAFDQGGTAEWGIDGLASVERARVTAQIGLRAKRSGAGVRVEEISLLDGRIELHGAALSATAESHGGRAGGELELGATTQLLVDGAPREASVNQRIAIEGVGTVIVNEQAVLANAPTGDAQTGPRYRIVGALAHVRLTAETAGLPAGSEIIIGRVDAGVREGKVREIAHPSSGVDAQPPTPSGIASSPTSEIGQPKPGETTLPRRPTSVRGNTGRGGIRGNLQGYLFPVLGQSNYVNTWGAARASTGVPHQGTDIFAAEGTPVVATADGVLDRVGWNTIGGYRLWIFDQYGNSFYYAHLSAFSPLAVEGATVKRGDVIAFVGHTGDAQYTPPHLHFEVHPNNGAASNPFPFLNAWQHGVAVAIGLLTGGKDRVAPLALLGFTDISANSGLQDSVLDTVPDTRARSIEQENAPRPTDESLKGAIEGPGTSAG
jgi:murein DD-endopeptidase MepM/ murein hydrolase activator NlpD